MIRAKTDMQDRLIEIGEILVPFACHTRYGEAGWRKGGGGRWEGRVHVPSESCSEMKWDGCKMTPVKQ
jgi:hypothetical protein